MKKRFIYFGLVFIAILIVSISCFSYAFFANKIEEHGKLNMVVGTLDYKLESSDLENNKITVNANTMEILTINLKSLNTIKSKYELYYNASDDNDLIIGYGDDSEVTGIVDANSSKKITVIIRNISDTNKEVEFGVQGGFINNELLLGSNKTTLYSYCNLKQEYSFDYTGNEQEFIVPCNGEYQLETWGAQGGNYIQTNDIGGYGGYSSGYINLNQYKKIFLNVGGAGKLSTSKTGAEGGYNGGGKGGDGLFIWETNYIGGGSGGGATHIATKSGLLSTLENNISDIVIVSGGGGGASRYSISGSGGGFLGNDSVISAEVSAYCNSSIFKTNGGTQTSGYKFGQGQDGYDREYGSSCGAEGIGGGGGGFYGGTTFQSDGVGTSLSGAGGSGYIGNSLLTNKVMYCYECEESSEESTKTVSTTNVSGAPIGNYAKIGNGYAKINYIPADTSDTTNIIVFNSKISNGVTKGDNIKILENSDTEIIEKNIRCVSNKDGYIVDTSNLSLGNHQITCTSKINNKTVEVKSTDIEVTYKAYTVTNLIENGSFDNGLTGWQNSSNSFLTVTNGIAAFTSPTEAWSGSFGTTYLIADVNTLSHKFYLQVKAKIASNSYAMGFGDDLYGGFVYTASELNYIQNQYTISSAIVQPSSISSTISTAYFGFYHYKATSIQETSYIDHCFVIDLTATFGAGNEPDKEWCDNHIDYFDGSSTIYK